MPKLVTVAGDTAEAVLGKDSDEATDANPVDTTEAEPVVEPVEEVDPIELEDDEEYWPGGPNGAQVKEWKKAFGDVYVTSVTPEHHIVWRTLTRFEYRRLVKQLDQQASSGTVSQAEANLNNEEAIAETVILFPPYDRNQVGGYMAGVASLISQEAMEASGFVALEIRQL